MLSTERQIPHDLTSVWIFKVNLIETGVGEMVKGWVLVKGYKIFIKQEKYVTVIYSSTL